MYGLCTTVLSAFLAAHADDGRPALTSLPHGNAVSVAKVRRVDREAGSSVLQDIGRDAEPARINVRLYAIHPSMLDHIAAGDRVEFQAENRNGSLILTDVRPWCGR